MAKPTQTRKTQLTHYCVERDGENTSNMYEIGVDEAGRGPLFGRVYAAAVVLPPIDSCCDFDTSLLKDSKRFTSKKKIVQVYNDIKQYALAYSVAYCDEKEVDTLNIRKATHKAMHKSIKDVITQLRSKEARFLLCIDGNDFTPYTSYNEQSQCIEQYNHICVTQGDNTFCHIAAASILAKVERDNYIGELCLEHPYLETHYSIASNKGYGAKKHIDGIKLHGITEWHRKTFGICKNY